MNRIKRSYMFLVSFLLPLSLFAVNVSGTVSDAATGNALAGANVVVEGTDLEPPQAVMEAIPLQTYLPAQP